MYTLSDALEDRALRRRGVAVEDSRSGCASTREP
jgi:hypothetical protein